MLGYQARFPHIFDFSRIYQLESAKRFRHMRQDEREFILKYTNDDNRDLPTFKIGLMLDAFIDSHQRLKSTKLGSGQKFAVRETLQSGIFHTYALVTMADKMTGESSG
jgi:hypothetical protein